ncbi:hypothetical protein [Segeticoccus rhizosphaerae]|uniref:hypothetical protein n=1 Tax=Segeticoccus rhizosphaerae TaxID=1104777 RepID=UPI0012646D25|nr:hypothetical protein [Segeticoccus rhizosphaerae]
MSAVSVLAGMGSTVPWPPQGAGDFADVAWVVAQALGNGPGVRRLNMSPTGRRVFVEVTVTSPGFVSETAARLGWSLSSANDDHYANCHGPLGSLVVDVTWLADKDSSTASPEPDRREGAGVSS